MRDAVVCLGLQPDALQQSVAELKPGCIEPTQSKTGQNGEDLTLHGKQYPVTLHLALMAALSSPGYWKICLNPLCLKKAELSHRLSG